MQDGGDDDEDGFEQDGFEQEKKGRKRKIPLTFSPATMCLGCL